MRDAPEATSSGLNYTAAIAYGIIKPMIIENRVGCIPGTSELASKAVRKELRRYGIGLRFEGDTEQWRLYHTAKRRNQRFTLYIGTFVKCCRRAVEIIHHA